MNPRSNAPWRIISAIAIVMFVGILAAAGNPPAETTATRNVETKDAEATTKSTIDKKDNVPEDKRPNRRRLPNLCLRPDKVFIGALVSRDESVAVRNQTGGESLYTDVNFQISHVIAGDIYSGDTFKLRIPGGQIGTRKVWSSATPKFITGETYVVFLIDLPNRRDAGILEYRRIPLEFVELLPDQMTVRNFWEAACGANPDGIYAGEGPPVRPPPGITVEDIANFNRISDGRFAVQTIGE